MVYGQASRGLVQARRPLSRGTIPSERSAELIVGVSGSPPLVGRRMKVRMSVRAIANLGGTAETFRPYVGWKVFYS